MAPNKSNDSVSVKAKASASRELQSVKQQQGGKGLYPKMAETSIVVDPCAENKICSSKKGHMTDSTTSLQSCSCGPECGPDKCQGRKSTTLVAWDEMRTKIFILLFAAFAVWLLIYIPISVTMMKEKPPEEGNSEPRIHQHHGGSSHHDGHGHAHH